MGGKGFDSPNGENIWPKSKEGESEWKGSLLVKIEQMRYKAT